MTDVGGQVDDHDVDGGENENDGGRSGHDYDCDWEHVHDVNDCGYDFSRILRVQHSRSGCGESHSMVPECCIPSRGCLDTGRLMQVLELAGRKDVNDDAWGWTGRRTT